MTKGYVLVEEQSHFERIIPRILERKTWGLDTETTGLDPHVNKVILMQIGRPEKVFLIDTRKVNVAPLKESFFENKDYRKVGHNMKFDYKMMRGSFNIMLENVRDTFIGEKVLSAGLPIYYLSPQHKLDAVLRKYRVADIQNKKDMQKSFIDHVGPFSQDQLDYAGGDVEYQLPLLEKQQALMRGMGLWPTFVLECDVLPAFGDMEFEGMRLDTHQWRIILEDNKRILEELQQKLNEMAVPVLGANLFGEAWVNWGSPKQVLDVLRKMKLTYKIYNRDTKKEEEIQIDKTNDNILKMIKGVPLVDTLRDWRSYNMLINNFGEKYINAVHPITGLIHPNLFQLGAGTGRPAAGESDINPLNVPRDQRYRSCFIGDEDEVVESDDFSGCESRILAHISKDPVMTDIFRKGEDIHCGAATRLYGVEVTKKNENKHLRTPAKALNFGIAYGQGPNALHDKLNSEGFPITREKARQLYYKFTDEFSAAVGYIRSMGKVAVEQGWLANLNGRRRWWEIPVRGSVPEGIYNGKIAAIEREAGNYMIQSVNADMTKKAMIDIREYRKKHMVRTKFINAVYDEIVTRTHKDDSPSFHEAKLKIMRAAGEKWVTSVPMEVDGNVGRCWLKG
jgi:DNA polymerase I-like protein with 3'-5' exonuclease and polymerase domains